MRDNRCPSCNNDLTQTVNGAIIARLQQPDDEASSVVTCPHCAADLSVAMSIRTTLVAVDQNAAIF